MNIEGPVEMMLNKIVGIRDVTWLFVFRSGPLETWVKVASQAAEIAYERGWISWWSIHITKDNSHPPCMLIMKQRWQWQ